MSERPLLQVQHLKKYYSMKTGLFSRAAGVVKAVDDISFQLESSLDSLNPMPAVKVTAKENWSYTWTDLDEKAGGQTIVYTVDEVAVPDFYEKEISGDAAEGFIITNSHTPKPPVVPPPRTGDESHLVRYTMLMSLSFAGIVFVLTNAMRLGTGFTPTWEITVHEGS